MKRLFTIALILVSAATAVAAERIFIITDRNTYVAGDLVFCSVYALDQNGRIKDYSAVPPTPPTGGENRQRGGFLVRKGW